MTVEGGGVHGEPAVLAPPVHPNLGGPRGTRRVLRYADLGATVYPYCVPQGLAEELPGLYGSVFATLDWFLAWDRLLPTGACVLDDPHHVILFCVEGATIEVLNKVFEIAPDDAARLCRALFRALPLALRIHLEVMFPPYMLGLSNRRLRTGDHMMIELPDSVAAYNASLGKSTRRTIRGYSNRLHRDFPDLSTEVVAPGRRAAQLVQQVVDWKIERFGREGRTTYWEIETDRAARAAHLALRCLEAHVTSIAGREVAVHLVCPVGDRVCALEGAFDPAYESYRLGFLSMYWVVCDAVARGARRLDAHVGTPNPKMLLGARRVPASTLSVFRSRLVRPLYLNEAATLTWHRRRTYYWGARYIVGRLVRLAGQL